MPAPVNGFKAALREGRTLYGFWVAMADPYAAEIAAQAGFDWILFDGEHAPNDLRSIVAQLQVAAAFPSHPIVRLPVGDPTLIKQFLDAGVQTLLVPMVDDAETAEALVRAVRYPPRGARGIGAGLGRASRFNAIPDYMETADDQICLIVQAETRRALDSLDDILAVDGVDAVFIGPNDLAADMGFPGRLDAPEVRDAIRDALGRIRAAGKGAGMLDFDPRAVAGHRENGANIIAVGADTPMLAKVAADLAARFRD
jgi:4-hydroxy-2-oxoheptanedioate aldolase